jgi:hypothetical protein
VLLLPYPPSLSLSSELLVLLGDESTLSLLLSLFDSDVMVFCFVLSFSSDEHERGTKIISRIIKIMIAAVIIGSQTSPVCVGMFLLLLLFFIFNLKRSISPFRRIYQ